MATPEQRGNPSISFTDPNVVRVADVPRHLPPGRNGKAVSSSAVRRWIVDGLAGEAPPPTVHIGGTLCIDLTELQRFFDRVSRAKRRGKTVAANPSAAGERAARELEAAGI